MTQYTLITDEGLRGCAWSLVKLSWEDKPTEVASGLEPSYDKCLEAVQRWIDGDRPYAGKKYRKGPQC